MLELVIVAVRAFSSALRGHRELVLENLALRQQLAGMGIAEVISAPASPWQNPYAERVIGSIRRECLDHVIVLNRTHLGLEKDAPDPRLISATSAGPIIAIPEVGGLHHHYERQAA